MRVSLFLIPLALAATPAIAQAPAVPDKVEIPAQLTDPAVADRLADVMQILSKVLLDIPVGEVMAATQGRQAGVAEKAMTVRDLGRKEDPNFEHKLEQQMAQAKPMMRQSLKALADALPAMMQSAVETSKAMERAAANLPNPSYPKR